MRKVLTAITVLTVMFIALPASASECLSLTIDDYIVTSVSEQNENIRIGIIGDFLWVQTGPNVGQDEYEGTISFAVNDATGATVCDDQTVTFTYDEFESVAVTVDPPAVEAPTPEEVAAAPELDYSLFGGLGRYAFDA